MERLGNLGEGTQVSALIWQLFYKLKLFQNKLLKKLNWGEERNGIYSKPDLKDSVTIFKTVLCQGTQTPWA